MTRLLLSELTKMYDNIVGVTDINLDIDFNGLGIVGPNGSGKTTLIKLLLGIIHPTYGSIDIDIPRKDIRVVFDQPNLPGKLTIDRWIYTLEQLYGHPAITGVDFQTELGLDGHWLIENLSSGQRRKVSLLSVFYGTPKLIIIDEPTNFLDIQTRHYILEMLKLQINRTGSDIIVSSHDVDEIRYFTQDVIFLQQGRLAKTIKLAKRVPRYFEVQPDDFEAFVKLLENHEIKFTFEDTIRGEVIRIKPSEKLWLVIDEFAQSGGQIVTMKVIDSLEGMIEGMLT